MLLSYFEGHFSPAEAAACTGLPLTLQRDWRALGLLASNEGGHARFRPHELAMMKIMVHLRRHGFKPARAFAAAARSAPILLYHCIDHPGLGLALDDPSWRGQRYLKRLEATTDHRFRFDLVDVNGSEVGSYLWLPEEGDPRIISDLDIISRDESLEDFSCLSFVTMAAKLVAKLPRPLFTLKVPKMFD